MDFAVVEARYVAAAWRLDQSTPWPAATYQRSCRLTKHHLQRALCGGGALGSSELPWDPGSAERSRRLQVGSLWLPASRRYQGRRGAGAGWRGVRAGAGGPGQRERRRHPAGRRASRSTWPNCWERWRRFWRARWRS